MSNIGTAASGKILQGAGTGAGPTFSTATFPSIATGTGKVLIADGTNWVASTPTFPNASATSGKIIQSDGTNWLASTPTFPTTAGTSGKILISDGTNIISSTPTYPNSASGTGTILRADGTNWVATTSTYPNTNALNTILYASSANVMSALSTAVNGVLITDGTTGIPSISSTLPSAVQGNITSVGTVTSGTWNGTAIDVAHGGTGRATLTNHGVLIGAATTAITQLAAGSAGQVLQSGGASADPAYSTATYPATATGTGTILRADGTNWSATTSTYPNTNAVSTLLYASSANVMAALATANSAILATNSSGVPSITTASGNWLNTSRTAFLVYVATTINNVTGDGTVYTLIPDTKSYDQGTDFTLASGTFTAPVTGRYFLNFDVLVVGATAFTAANTRIVTTANTFNTTIGAGASLATTNSSINMSVIANMTAADTATFTIATTDSGGKVDDISGTTSGNLRTWVSGYLVC